MKLVRGLLCSLAVGLTAAPSARAFKGPEHVRTSNQAFCIAKSYVARQGSDLERHLADFFARDGYGDLVRGVDYLLDPVDYLVHFGCAHDYPEDVPEEVQTLARRRHWHRHFHAAHNNEAHFQSQALTSFWFFHAAAVKVAAGGDDDSCARDGTGRGGSCSTRSLHVALAINSYADHLLQDLFAPGHVITPRNTMHDIIAIAMHDRFNAMGAIFHLSPDGWKDLSKLLSSETTDCFPSSACRDWQQVTQNIESDHELQLLGDGKLHASAEQELFLTLLTARSIADVLESFLDGRPTNSFGSYEWRPMRVSEQGLELASFALPQGEYEPRSTNGLLFSGLAVGVGYSYEYFASNCCDEPGRGVFTTELITSILPPGRKNEHGIYVRKPYQLGLIPGYSYVWNDALHGHGVSLRPTLAIPKLDIQFSVEGGYRWYETDHHRRYSGTHWGPRFDVGFSLFTLHLAVVREHGRDFILTRAGPQEPVEHGWAAKAGFTFGIPLTRVPLIKQLFHKRVAKKRKAPPGLAN